VSEGLSLNQLRLVVGDPRVPDDEIRRLHHDEPVLFLGGDPMPDEDISLSDGLFLSLDLQKGPSGVVGYRAKKNSQLLDLSQVAHYDPELFWEPLVPERECRLILEPEEFYLLLSAEAVSVPPRYAAEMTAYDPTSG